MTDPEQELELLEKFHSEVASREGEAQASLIRNGYLPDSESGLIEAGVRCIPLVQEGHLPVADAAAARLEAVVFKLRRLQETLEVRKAVEQFEALIQARRKAGASDMRFGLALILGLAALLALIAFYIIRVFFR